MYICLDAAYELSIGLACGVIFDSIGSQKPAKVITGRKLKVKPYIPGKFYERELPLLLSVLERVEEDLNIIFIDGYVWLPGNRPGLGAHLFKSQNEKIPVIGIAKNLFKGHRECLKVYRGKSSRPLFITSAGISIKAAAKIVEKLHGQNRVPYMVTLSHIMAQKALDEKLNRHQSR